MRKRWRAAYPPPPASQRPKPRNVQAVLDLKETVYVTFRGRQYGIPPVPYDEGHRILEAYLRVEACGEEITLDTLPVYRDAIATLARLLRRRLRTGGSSLRRFLYRLGFFDPMKEATDADVLGLAVFLLGRRTKSSGVELLDRAPAPRT